MIVVECKHMKKHHILDIAPDENEADKEWYRTMIEHVARRLFRENDDLPASEVCGFVEDAIDLRTAQLAFKKKWEYVYPEKTMQTLLATEIKALRRIHAMADLEVQNS